MKKLRPRPGHPAPKDFNPQSPDAMFAVILQRLDQQDQVTELHHAENKKELGEIRTQTTITNGRVGKLEKKWIYVMGWAAGISLAVSAVAALVALAIRFL
jgi:hypothetical protein